MINFLIEDSSDVSAEFSRQVEEHLDRLAIPKGCLGELHVLSRQLCFIQRSCKPVLKSGTALVFAGDHGIARKGVSAFPKRATFENFRNMLAGRTVISGFCRVVGLDEWYIDIGIDGPHLQAEPGSKCRFIDARVRDGTADCSEMPAMSIEEAERGIESGYRIAREAGATADAVIVGEMGIGNSSIASLITAACLGVPSDSVTGRGSGLDDQGLDKKRAVLRGALRRRDWSRLNTLEILAELGGHEINGMVGAMLGAASARKVVLVDGFIAAAAALAAVALEPACRGYLVAASQSTEPGYELAARHLNFRPLLRLGLRLGEGSAAALAWPIVRASADYLTSVYEVSELGWLIESQGNTRDSVP